MTASNPKSSKYYRESEGYSTDILWVGTKSCVVRSVVMANKAVRNVLCLHRNRLWLWDVWQKVADYCGRRNLCPWGIEGWAGAIRMHMMSINLRSIFTVTSYQKGPWSLIFRARNPIGGLEATAMRHGKSGRRWTEDETGQSRAIAKGTHLLQNISGRDHKNVSFQVKSYCCYNRCLVVKWKICHHGFNLVLGRYRAQRLHTPKSSKGHPRKLGFSLTPSKNTELAGLESESRRSRSMSRSS